MSCTYKFRMKLRTGGGKSTSCMVQTWTFPRADAETHLAKLKAKTDRHKGEEQLMEMIAFALENKSRRKITIKVTHSK
jgi:hypothetical protein